MRVCVSGSPNCPSSSSFSFLSASRLRRRVSRSMPLGSLTYRIGSPDERHCTPCKTDGRKPLPQVLFPPVGSLPPLIKTTNPGRSWLSEPSPYVIHEPIDALPNRGEPVNSMRSAGAWLNWSVFIERTTAISSTILLTWGNKSLTHVPDWPRCSNLCGHPSSFGCPLMNAKRWFFSSSSGQGCIFSFTSVGL